MSINKKIILLTLCISLSSTQLSFASTQIKNTRSAELESEIKSSDKEPTDKSEYMFNLRKTKAAKLAETAIEKAKNNLSLNSDEGRKSAHAILFGAIQSLETLENTDHNSRLFMYLGDTYLQSGDIETALSAYGDAVYSPNGLGDPEIHLRIGKAFFEVNDEKQALDNLARALIMGGKEIFEGEDTKYFKSVTSVLDTPQGGWDNYEPPEK